MKKLKATCFAVSAFYSIAMPAIPDTFASPGIAAEWHDNASAAVNITIYDNSNCENSYRIYRAPGYSSVFSRIAQIVSKNPAQKDTIVFYDSTVSPNAFYSYEAVACRGTDTISSTVSTIFTFQFSVPRSLAHLTKISNFPISLSGGWSALAGDSVILKESATPTGKFTVINVQNPSVPRSAGYIDSSALSSYPLKTLIPIYLMSHMVNSYGFTGGHGVFCVKNSYAVVVNSPDISLFQFGHKSFTLIGTYRDENIAAAAPLNDSLLCVMSGNVSAVDGSYSYLYPMKISAAAGLIIGNPIEVGSYRYGAMSSSLSPYVRGVYSNALLIGETFYDYPFNSWQNMIAYDLDSMQSLTYSNVGASSWGSYSGYLLSATQFLSLDEGHVYAEDPRDLNAYQTALDNNAILTDSFSGRQNVLVDTVNKRLYILYTANMSIFSYAFLPTVGVRNNLSRRRQLRAELRILPTRSGVNIVFPGNARHADLFFYDPFGRMVDKLTVTGSNSVLWRPKARGIGCFSVSAEIDGVNYFGEFHGEMKTAEI